MAEGKVGCPPGKGTVQTQTGGLIGNPPHVRSEEIAEKVRELGRIVSRDQTARLCGISKSTLLRHYHEEWQWAQDNLVHDLKAMLIEQAVKEKSVNAAKAVLVMCGEFKQKFEHSGPGGGPIRTLDQAVLAQLVDGKSEQELIALEQALSLVLAATGAAGGPGDGPADAELRPAGEEAEGA